ncbi:hypothetical protein [Brevundimonas sp.]|uniref:hypothetical protein n=1 Tax=Brevundimonas sp. TaxID=1871086 RepID=UPI0025BBAA4C|nr:hypothetical protein [Brevundimonas sp.]
MFKKLFIAALTAAAFVVPTTVANAQFDPNYPPPGTPGVYRWYSTYEHTNETGYRIVECDGTVRGPYGQRTLHQTFQPFTC